MNLNFIALQDAAAGGMSSIIMIVAMIAIFYFFLIRPQNKKQKEIKKFRDGLQNGDKVVTAGGIYGKIRQIKETTIILEVSNGISLTIDKGSVYPTAADVQLPDNQNK